MVVKVEDKTTKRRITHLHNTHSRTERDTHGVSQCARHATVIDRITFLSLKGASTPSSTFDHFTCSFILGLALKLQEAVLFLVVYGGALLSKIPSHAHTHKCMHHVILTCYFTTVQICVNYQGTHFLSNVSLKPPAIIYISTSPKRITVRTENHDLRLLPCFFSFFLPTFGCQSFFFYHRQSQCPCAAGDDRAKDSSMWTKPMRQLPDAER